MDIDFLRDDAHMMSMKIVQDPQTLVSLRPKFFHPLDLGRPVLNETLPPLPMLSKW